MKKVFISQPMAGKEEWEIAEERKSIVAELERVYGEVEILDSLFKDLPSNAPKVPEKAVPLQYLGESIKVLGYADIAVFAKGWKNASGCFIEHSVCLNYGILTIDMDNE